MNTLYLISVASFTAFHVSAQGAFEVHDTYIVQDVLTTYTNNLLDQTAFNPVGAEPVTPVSYSGVQLTSVPDVNLLTSTIILPETTPSFTPPTLVPTLRDISTTTTEARVSSTPTFDSVTQTQSNTGLLSISTRSPYNQEYVTTVETFYTTVTDCNSLHPSTSELEQRPTVSTNGAVPTIRGVISKPIAISASVASGSRSRYTSVTPQWNWNSSVITIANVSIPTSSFGVTSVKTFLVTQWDIATQISTVTTTTETVTITTSTAASDLAMSDGVVRSSIYNSLSPASITTVDGTPVLIIPAPCEPTATESNTPVNALAWPFFNWPEEQWSRAQGTSNLKYLTRSYSAPYVAPVPSRILGENPSANAPELVVLSERSDKEDPIDSGAVTLVKDNAELIVLRVDVITVPIIVATSVGSSLAIIPTATVLTVPVLPTIGLPAFSFPVVPTFSLPSLSAPSVPTLSLPSATISALSLPSLSLPAIPTPSLPSLSVPTVPTLSLPSLTVPSLSLPSLPVPTIPTVSLPSLSLPAIPTPSLPSLSVPTLSFPSLSIPAIPTPSLPSLSVPTVPTLSLPSLTVPSLSLPSLPVPTIPTVSLPSLSLPVIPTPSLPSLSVPTLSFPSLSIPIFSLPCASVDFEPYELTLTVDGITLTETIPFLCIPVTVTPTLPLSPGSTLGSLVPTATEALTSTKVSATSLTPTFSTTVSETFVTAGVSLSLAAVSVYSSHSTWNSLGETSLTSPSTRSVNWPQLSTSDLETLGVSSTRPVGVVSTATFSSPSELSESSSLLIPTESHVAPSNSRATFSITESQTFASTAVESDSLSLIWSTSISGSAMTASGGTSSTSPSFTTRSNSHTAQTGSTSTSKDGHYTCVAWGGSDNVLICSTGSQRQFPFAGLLLAGAIYLLVSF